MSKLKIVSLNARGLRDNKKRNEVTNYLKKQSSDIICLQETHTLPSDLWISHSKNAFLSHGTNQSRGVCTIVVNPNIEVKNSKVDSEGRYVILELGWQDKLFQIANIYGPNTDELTFFYQGV